jgi:hypothetical protein
MTPDEREKLYRSDIGFLIQRAEFTRFIFRVIQSSRIFSSAADGSDTRNLNEGRRDLGLEILSMVEAGQPVAHPEGLPILTVLQALREEAIQQPQEKPNARTAERYDRSSELDDEDQADPA